MSYNKNVSSICPSCRLEISGSPQFCPHCGASVIAGGVSSSSPKQSSASGGGSASGVLWSTVGLIAGLGLTVAIVLFVRHQQDAKIADLASETHAQSQVMPGDIRVILRMHGSNTIGSVLAVDLAKSFLAKRGAKNVQTFTKSKDEILVTGSEAGNSVPQAIEIYAHGSGSGFADLAASRCDIAMASRRVEPSELSATAFLGDLTREASENVIALDGVAVIVNRANPARTLTVEQIRDLFSGKATDWKSTGLDYEGPVHVYARAEGSGTLETFRTLVMRKTSITDKATAIEDSTELSQKVSADAYGIGFIGLPYVLDAKAVAVAETEEGMGGDTKKLTTPLLPTVSTVATEDYPLSRRLYLYTAAVPTNHLVAEFVRFVKSDEGQDLVEKAKFVSQKVCPDCKRDVPLPPADAPSDYQQITQNAVRQPLDFHFRFGSAALDPKALDDVDRMARYLHDLNEEKDHVILLGFADNRGTAESNRKLSRERAEAIRAELAQRGTLALQVTGLGSEMPIKSNDTEEGREKNRRVEVWLKK